MALDPAVAAVRLAVRRSLSILTGTGAETRPADLGDVVLVACSGGADSLALLAATVFEAHKIPDVRVVGVTVDHGLQEGSAAQAERVIAQMVALGVDETAAIRVTVDPGPAGVEAGAREARYAALSQLAEHFAAEIVLLGHTLDDQAETVLLGLARGSGGRSLMGMRRGFRRDEGPDSLVEHNRHVPTPDGIQTEGLGPPLPRRSTLFLRPLLDLTRAQSEAACRAEGIIWWEDPHNTDPRFARSRVRHTVMPMLERELGPGVAQALARTADLVREDVTSLDDRAEVVLQELRVGDGFDTAALEALDPATKHRVIRRACLEAGAIPSELTRDHVLAVADIAYGARDPRQIQLPGHVTAYRDGGVLRFRRTVVG